MRLIEKFGIAVVIFFLFVSPARAEGDTASDISAKLICQCDCTMILSTCQCATKDEMIIVIDQKLDEGQSSKEIVDYFVAAYGERVLSAPPKQGFNLTAWILPFAVILGGGGIIYLAIRKWVKKGESSQADLIELIESKSSGQEDEYQQRLEEDLKDFSEGSFR
jgi:cytochrome c-type biogenesis protein CcmH